MRGSFCGVFVAMVTPMTDGQEVDFQVLEELTEHLIDSGVHGLIPLGSTGEFYALGPDERKRIVETVVRTCAGRVPVLVGANAGSTSDVVNYCRESECLGADGVLLAAPYYSLPGDDELLRHFEEAAESIGIPIMLYNYPGRTGVDLTPALVERLAEIDGIDYIKESSGDVTRVTDIIGRCGKNISVFCGSDTLALESFVTGAAGWVGGIANVIPRSHIALYDLAENSSHLDEARKLYFRLMPVLQMFEGGGCYTQLVKAACELRGLRVGPPRAPLRSINDDVARRLESVLEGLQ